MFHTIMYVFSLTQTWFYNVYWKIYMHLCSIIITTVDWNHTGESLNSRLNMWYIKIQNFFYLYYNTKEIFLIYWKTQFQPRKMNSIRLMAKIF